MEAMATKKTTKGDDDTLSVQLGVRVTAADAERIQALAERFPLFKGNAIARAALLIGLDAIEDSPTVLLGEKLKAKRKS